MSVDYFVGFAGGLHDRDLGFVRFGWRDFDTYTGRWTAPDPLRDAGGDPDWYGYCLDDPVNGVDPLGLLVWFLPFAVGMAGATAIGATGAYSSAKAADWLGEKTGKNDGNKPTATEGVHDAMGKVIGINSGIVGATGAAKAAPAAATAAMRHPDKTVAGTDFSLASSILARPPRLQGEWPEVELEKVLKKLKKDGGSDVEESEALGTVDGHTIHLYRTIWSSQW